MSAVADIAEKTCKRCGEGWPADNEFFNLQKGGRDGLAAICRACKWDCDAVRRKPEPPRLFDPLAARELQGFFVRLIQKQEQHNLVKP